MPLKVAFIFWVNFIVFRFFKNFNKITFKFLYTLKLYFSCFETSKNKLQKVSLKKEQSFYFCEKIFG